MLIHITWESFGDPTRLLFATSRASPTAPPPPTLQFFKNLHLKKKNGHNYAFCHLGTANANFFVIIPKNLMPWFVVESLYSSRQWRPCDWVLSLTWLSLQPYLLQGRLTSKLQDVIPIYYLGDMMTYNVTSVISRRPIFARESFMVQSICCSLWCAL